MQLQRRRGGGRPQRLGGPWPGKGQEVPEAIRKGVEQAKKNLIHVVVVNGTIPHEITGRYGASTIFLKPAAEGTGVIAGGAIKIVIESAGIKNILTNAWDHTTRTMR